MVLHVRSFASVLQIQVSALEGVSANRWQRFLASLRFEVCRMPPVDRHCLERYIISEMPAYKELVAGALRIQ